MNNKSTPNQMRILMKRVRENKVITEADNIPEKDLTVRDMLKLTRNFVNEDVETDVSLSDSDTQTSDDEANNENKKTRLDQEQEEEKFKNFFDDLNVHIDLDTIIVKGNGVFWTGVIDGVIRFVYKITNEDETSGVVLNYLRDGYENSESSMEIIERIKSYYDTFYKYWNRNLPTD